VRTETEPKFFKTLFDDIGQFFSDLFSGTFFKQLKRDFLEIREFFLDEYREKRLEQMGRFRRAWHLSWWLLKILFFRLASFRRILLILALLLIFTADNNGDVNDGKIIIGVLLFIFIILLELKDKLLARNELEAGKSIQQSLTPKQNPSVPGWDLWLFTRPANDVGGDLVDYLKINGNRFGLAIGDVAGKGLPAALLMAKLQATLRAVVPDFSSLSKLAEKLNAIFYRDSLPNRFASLVYLEITSDSNEIRFVNAGHIPPIISGEGKFSEMSKGAPALGIMPDSTYTEERCQLNARELFIVYSDGVTEARNEAGEFFGEKRFNDLLKNIDVLSATGAGTKILKTIDNFIGEARATDDLSMIILRRLD
jgi:sigma-B regulation protein RsbU (phosphoserine phosphatase)